MKKKGNEIVPKAASVIVLREPEEDPREKQLAEALEKIVRRQVEGILSQQSAILEPEFRPPAVSSSIMRRQSVFDRRKWSLYFDRWGCRQCVRLNVPHYAVGYCRRCFTRIRQRLHALEKQWNEQHPQQEVKVSQASELAKRVLMGLPAKPEGTGQ